VPGTVAIIIAKDDFTIPGGGIVANNGNAPDPEAQFFLLLSERHPDVVVLDFSQQYRDGLNAIAKIRARSDTPILVVTPPDAAGLPDFCAADAVDCIKAPVDILAFSQVLQRIIAERQRKASEAAADNSAAIMFAGLSLREYGNRLAGPNGNAAKLTTSESRVLSHLLSKPLRVCSRGEISEMLYGRHQPSSDRAIDIIINRLRKKLMMVAGPDAQNLIKTEFRRGYTLATARVEGAGLLGLDPLDAPEIVASGAA
jgi:DNA-binding response OmpR family regulator